MGDSTFLGDIGVVLLAALLGGLISRSLRLPLVVGYLITGIVIGPHTPGLIAEERTVHTIANLGVVLLMFVLGVQFSLEELKSVRDAALFGGGLQIVTTVLLVLVLALILGWGGYVGFFMGCAAALSSTTICLRLLEEQGEVGTTHGTLMLAVSIMQDLSLVLMVAVLPAVASLRLDAESLTAVGLGLGKGLLSVAVTLLLATAGAPALLHRVVRTGVRELFVLAVVGLVVGIAAVAEYVGLGLALGAFLAGLVVSESPYSHEVLAQVRPLRDVFASLFFVGIGMLLNPALLARSWVEVGVLAAAVVVGKPLLTMVALYPTGVHGRTLFLASVGLGQIGEYSFVLATLGSARGLVSPEVSGIILTAALVSLLVIPFLYPHADAVYRRMLLVPALSRILNRQPRKGALEGQPPVSSEGGVAVLGSGRVGRLVSDALRSKGIPQVVVDYDSEAVAKRKARGVPVVYGDAASPSVLEQVISPSTELVIVALPEAATTEMAIRAAKRIDPSIPVVARVHRGADMVRMRAAGASSVVHTEFEAGAEMVRQCLARLGFADTEVNEYVDELRQHRYSTEDPNTP